MAIIHGFLRIVVTSIEEDIFLGEYVEDFDFTRFGKCTLLRNDHDYLLTSGVVMAATKLNIPDSFSYRGETLICMRGRYLTGGTYIGVFTDGGEPYADMSVNIPGIDLSDNKIVIPLYNVGDLYDVFKDMFIRKSLN